jgi:hypothetical protein
MAFFDGRDFGFEIEVEKIERGKAKVKKGRGKNKGKASMARFVVCSVIDGNVAEGQGVEVGDVVLGFNSKPLVDYGIKEGMLAELQEKMRTMPRPVIIHFNQMDEVPQQAEAKEEPQKKEAGGFQFLSDRVKKSVEKHNTSVTKTSKGALKTQTNKPTWAAFKTADGTTYYCNIKTKKTVWHLPDSDWQITFEKQTGKPYYYNKITRETVWKKPEALSHVEVSTRVAGS